MIPALRQQFNQQFTNEKYQAYIHELESIYPGQVAFRLAETPVFVPKTFTQKMLDACHHIIKVVRQEGFKQQSEKAIPPHLRVPGENAFPHFIAFDFGICENGNGDLEPQLVEMQGFPTLFAWHTIVPEVAAKHFQLPENFSIYLNNFNKSSYIELLRKIIVGNENPEQVVLLEIFPHQQKTRVDFYATRDFLGVQPVCITEIIKEGKYLFYRNKGKKIQIKRIYNRVIFDELLQQKPEVQEKGKLIFQQEVNVDWIPHPNWFYRISKFTLPFIHHPNVPDTKFLNQIKTLPEDLENYVLKPLFSFAGQGVVIDVNREDIFKIKDPENWILQKKVNYSPFIVTPNQPAKAEIRLFYFWEPGQPQPVATNNLARITKGKMIGVGYNQNQDWVGGSFCLFEK